jgi:phage shock protein E
MSDYNTRAAQYSFSTPEQVQAALADESTYVLDVRNATEIAADGKIDHVRYVQSACTPDAAPELEGNASKLLPEKIATVVVYCKSGRRAYKAMQVLESQGYINVLNAGGYTDIVSNKDR